MAKNRTRRNKTEGGKRKNKTEGGNRKNKNKSEGGKRKTRKASSWTMKVTELYRKMKKNDSNVQFKDALVEASKLKKKGQL
jgi:hypothetical protein